MLLGLGAAPASTGAEITPATLTSD